MRDVDGCRIAKGKKYENKIGKPQLGILWSRDSLGFKRLCGNNPGTIWSTF